MTNQQPTGAQSEADTRNVATTQQTTKDQAASEASSVASSAMDTAKEVTHHAGAQAQDVVHEARAQAASLWGQTRSELDTQLEGRREHAATSLRSLSGELGALAEGRTSDATMLMNYIGQGRERVDSIAERMEQRSASELMGDVAGFARRRPGAFLAGAVVLGYVAGRAVKVGGSSSSNSSSSFDSSSSTGARGFTPGGSSFYSASGAGDSTQSIPASFDQSSGFTSPTVMTTDPDPLNPNLGDLGSSMGAGGSFADPETEQDR